MSSEVALSLAVLHRGLTRAVVGAGLPALGDPRRGYLRDDLGERGRRGLDRARAADVADGAVPDQRLVRRLGVGPAGMRVVGEQDAVALEYRPAVREVDGRDLELFPGDVVPDIELGPVRQRKDPDVLAPVNPGVVQAPQLGPLVLRVPLAELVAEGEHPLLRPGLLLVPAGAAEYRVEALVGDRVEQRRRLQPVPARPPAGLLHHPARVD